MKRVIARMQRDERGATLIFAIGFLIVIGTITAATLSFVSSGIGDRSILDSVRNRQYAADAGIEYEIAQTRALATPGINIAPTTCVSPGDVRPAIDGITIRVNCTNVTRMTTGLLLQRNVIFAACVDTGAACTDTNTIVRAQVNFQGGLDGATTGTTVQSWSVNA